MATKKEQNGKAVDDSKTVKGETVGRASKVVAKDETVKTDDKVTTTKVTNNAGNAGATPLAGNTREEKRSDVKVSDSVTYHLDKDPNDPRRQVTVDANDLPVVDINTPGEEPVKASKAKK